MQTTTATTTTPKSCSRHPVQTAQKVRRVDLEFGIGYSDDIEHAERLLVDSFDLGQ